MLRRWFRSIPLPLLRNGFILGTVGVFFIYSATFRTTNEFALRQFAWLLLSFGFLFMTVQLGYRYFLGISYAFYVLTMGLLVGVDFAGSTHLGAQRWLAFGPFSFQPSEFAKLATVLALAHFLGSRNPWEGEWRVLGITGLLVGIPFLLTLKQPDLGSALLFIPLALLLLFLWGIRLRYLFLTFLGTLLASPFLWNLLKDYQKKRILVFLNPDLDPLGAGYTAIQSRIAVGSGGLFGKGWLHGTQSQLDFVPEHHTDFIFSVIGEEFGFAGSIVIIALFGFLLLYVFEIMEHTTDLKARLLAIGIAAFLFFQVFVNIGMTIGLAPITGLTLPLVSYGGSSLVTTFFAMGLLVSIYKERSIF